jgi:hypothetical protein
MTAAPPAFTFQIEDKEYYCQVSTVAALSPVIHKEIAQSARSSQAAGMKSEIVTYGYQFASLKDPHGFFQQFIDLISGGEIEITFDNVFFLNAVANHLGIESLKALTDKLCHIAVTPATAIPLLRNLGEHGMDTSIATEFIVNHWSEFENNPQIQTLPLKSLDNMFNSGDFRPSHESVLFKLICKLVRDRGQEFAMLFRHCLFKDLNDRMLMEEFVNVVSYDEVPVAVFEILDDRLCSDIDDLENVPQTGFRQMYGAVPNRPASTGPLVRAASEQSRWPSAVPTAAIRPQTPQAAAMVQQAVMRSPVAAKMPSKASIYDSVIEFKFYAKYDDDYIFDGVLNGIKKEVGERWQEWIILSGGGSKERHLPHILDYDREQLFERYWDNYDTKDGIKASNAWLKVQFAQHKLILTHYSVATSSKQYPFHSQMRSWRLEGSMDGKNNWVVLSSYMKSDRLKEKEAMATFSVTGGKQTQGYSYFRLVQIENFAKAGATNMGEMKINALEFYGTLIKL